MLSPIPSEMYVPLLRAEREREAARERLAAGAARAERAGGVAGRFRSFAAAFRPSRRTAGQPVAAMRGE